MKTEVYVNGNCYHCIPIIWYLLERGLSFTVIAKCEIFINEIFGLYERTSCYIRK